MPLQIELDVYSGRPNPVWNLDPKETEFLLAQLEKLPSAPDVTPPTERLGYRGFIIKPASGTRSNWEELMVGFGVVSERQGLTVKYALDKSRTLERWLVESAKGKIGEDLFSYVLSEVEKS